MLLAIVTYRKMPWQKIIKAYEAFTGGNYVIDYQ